MEQQEAEALVASVKQWHHQYEIFPGVITPGTYGCTTLLERLKLPEDLKGARVLDIGSCDGFFSLTCAQRGADVTAVDYKDRTQSGFSVMEKISGLSFTHIHDNLWNLPSHNLGQFDIVLFLGVLYHLPDPVRGLTIVADHCKQDMYLETACRAIEVDGQVAEAPLMEFTPRDTWLGDITNFWRPNPPCLRAMVEDAEFEIQDEFVGEMRMVLRAKRIEDNQLARRKTVAYGLRRG